MVEACNDADHLRIKYECIILLSLVCFQPSAGANHTTKAGTQTKILTFDTFQEIFRENAEATGKAVDLLRRIDEEAAAALASSVVTKKAHRLLLQHSASSAGLMTGNAPPSLLPSSPPAVGNAASAPPPVAGSETSVASGSVKDAPVEFTAVWCTVYVLLHAFPLPLSHNIYICIYFILYI